jgi:hypothetical protein
VFLYDFTFFVLKTRPFFKRMIIALSGLPDKKALAGCDLPDKFQQLRIRIENRQMRVIRFRKDHALACPDIEIPIVHLIRNALR